MPGETGALLERAASVLSAARAHHMPVFHVAVRFRPGTRRRLAACVCCHAIRARLMQHVSLTGYPEISPDNKMFSGVKSGGGMLVEGTHGAAIHEAVAPQGGEPVVVKRRVGAFSTTDLATLLRARDIKHIVLMGVSTRWRSRRAGAHAAASQRATARAAESFCLPCAGLPMRTSASRSLPTVAQIVRGRRGSCATAPLTKLHAGDEEVHHVLTTKVFLRQADVTTAAEFVSSLSGV